ncbi:MULTISPECIES: 5-dehydro-4-deoxyglucarate dehydratase [unclassified Streptomyces]|uniref:5-dehydro-4-deoxyglucarate dehydratase n=1 Tax=unclassified Streptomyces TaxID=2593676 RepID=UPI002DD9A501|nr:5-dehydro-4-deoxyglucarate dehydratase [Streptomyces sp. NBC_01795]WSA96151.1 5-dehydro-4-deoxyglucarate dehydratase [Streptomyces sp. NBC_01795]WSS39935.1 5-dehydro-4-deoxyglucarate dehydratase [Streptomyces sp. NBC_01187]
MVLPQQHPANSLSGLLGFPVTPFRPDDGELDLPRFEQHLTDMLKAGPSALFVACGTGEFASLTVGEHHELVRTAVSHVAGEVPVYAGAGGGTRLAVEFVRSAERAGADGALILPPYLQVGPPAGLVAHYRQIAAATRLPLIPYQRSTAVFTPEAVAELAGLEQVVAFKDGHGDVELLQRIHTATGGELTLLNGMPTAETFAPAYAAAGARAYSSATLAFAPAIARAFYDAFTRGDDAVQQTLLREFYVPLTRLRHTTNGYAVSLVKAGLEAQGRPAGPVRPPLAEVTPEHMAELAALIERGHTAVDGIAG